MLFVCRDGVRGIRLAGVARCDQRVAAEVARIVPRKVKAVVAFAKVLVGRLQPLEQRDDGLGVVGQRRFRPALLDPPVPRTHVLADVAAVHVVAEGLPVGLRNRARRLRPAGEAACRVEDSYLVERSGGARVDATGAGAAIELEPWARFDLRGGDERAEDDPGAEAARDQQRVLAVEADARAGGALAVDVLIRIHEHAVAAADSLAERLELRPQLRVVVLPRVARQPSLVARRSRPGSVVAEGRRDHRSRAREEAFRVTGDLGLRHREAHPREEPPGPALADMTLGLLVRLGGRRADDVDPELAGDALELALSHQTAR